MDATTTIEARLQNRRQAVCGDAADSVLRLLAIAGQRAIETDLVDVAVIFKKTPYIADSKLARRYVAKDMPEVGCIPFLLNTLSDHDDLHGDCLTVIEPGGTPEKNSYADI